MITFGKGEPVPMGGFFTLEKYLIGRSLSEMEGLLGYERGRLIQGAAIFILNCPIRTFDFDNMGTSVFQGHRIDAIENSTPKGVNTLMRAINNPDAKERNLKSFQQGRLIKVCPLELHAEAFRRHLTGAEMILLNHTETNVRGETIEHAKKKLQHKLNCTDERIEELFKKADILRMNTNDSMYPSSTSAGVPQWKLKIKVTANCVCRMTNYGSERYAKVY